MNLGFLFGAGVSIASGAPTTEKFTEIVLRGENVQRHSDANYFLGSENYSGQNHASLLQEIRELLAFLHEHANAFFEREKERRRVANYEDLYYLVTQLADAAEDYENPAISGLLVFARQRVSSDEVFHEARQYIRGIVSSTLRGLERTPGHVGQLIEGAADSTLHKLQIFTLNHDLLIEEALTQGSVPFSNGFRQVPSGPRCWDKTNFAGNSEKTWLVKLHGSIDWYSTPGSSRDLSSKVCLETDDSFHVLPGGPEILIGTFNKMFDYTTSGIHADLFCTFRSALMQMKRLVISGYSFGDKGINASIAEWLRGNSQNHALIISPDADRYPQTARGAIRKLFEDCPHQIQRENRTFEEVAWEQIRGWSLCVS